MVGHTFIFNMAVQQIKKYIDNGDLGDIYYIFSQRLNLGRVRQDVNAMWNLAPHDISIILYWLGEQPTKVKAK
ncbi:oxidoreductase, Gfo/Idh/MocA family/transferase hexapeptide repeat protein, partial [Candidatus Magnetomorum sp. HK-1]